MKPEYDNAIVISDQLLSLLNTEGWKIVEDLFNSKKQEFITHLIEDKDLNNVHYYQLGIQVIDDILNEIQALIRAGIEVRRLNNG